MSKQEETIYKRKDGRWEERYLTYKNDAKRYISIYSKTDARFKEKTVKNLFAKWQRKKSSLIKPSSYIRYKGGLIPTYCLL